MYEVFALNNENNLWKSMFHTVRKPNLFKSNIQNIKEQIFIKKQKLLRQAI